MRKYELSEEVNINYINAPLYRIRALRDIPRYNIKAGDLGGLIESENNLSQEGDAWVAYGAMVFDDALAMDDAYVGGATMVFEHATIKKDAYTSGRARISGDAVIGGNATISGTIIIYDNVVITGDTYIFGNGTISRYFIVQQ